MILPTRRTLLWMTVGFAVSLMPALVSASLWPCWVLTLGLFVLFGGFDALWVGAPSTWLLSFEAPKLLYVGSQDVATLTLSMTGRRRAVRVELLAELSDTLQSQPIQSFVVVGKAVSETTIELVPVRRGESQVHALWLRWYGPLGLMVRAKRYPVDACSKVLPNVRRVRGAALRFFDNRHFLTGLKQEHYIGDGSEFESLREYMPGLDHRAIDWKASARHMKLLCREFRAERNHQVILAFDTGHLMREPIDGLPRLDHAINSALLLGYVSLKAGDRVGLFGFDERVRLYSKPQGGVASIHRLVEQTGGLDYGMSETNFTLGLTTLLGHLSRRSLVIVFTDFADSVSAELMVDNVLRLAKRHLVLFVTLRDGSLDRLVRREPTSILSLNEAVVAADLVRERDLVLRRLRRRGVHCIDTTTGQVQVALINRYLDIQRRELVS